MVAEAIINFEGNFARKIFVNLGKRKYFRESNYSSRSVIEMMRHFYMKRYPRERGKKLDTTLGGGDYSRVGYYSRKYVV